MNDIRRTILWVVFGFSMVLLWDQWQLYNGRMPTFSHAPPANRHRPRRTAPAASRQCQYQREPRCNLPAALPASAASAGGEVTSAAAAPKERFDVVTDVFKLTFDTEGGSLVRAELLKYADTAKTRPRTLCSWMTPRTASTWRRSGVVAGAGWRRLPDPQDGDGSSNGPRALAGRPKHRWCFSSPRPR